MKHRFILLTLVIVNLLCGCANFQNTSGKVLTTAALTVDATMHGWAKWSATHPVSDETHAYVRRAYERYQSAMSQAVEAYAAAVNAGDRLGWTQAKASLDASVSSLTTLIQTSSTP